ncbi:uncharacterized protein LOC111297842 [Durio zibethinus]|uniref:Uncharacterized protein LOC111297842 n=1 Tax=Durio zibethinus TaxID=66656 RepID=A0A6P5Z625_DURZI|nr:uncharacterized protein LOC111297842 [Durio zibethinus]
MASVASFQSLYATSLKQSPVSRSHSLSSRYAVAAAPLRSTVLSRTKSQKNQKRSLTVVAAVGDVSPDSTTYLIAGAAVVALVGTAFPLLFSRKDICPECDGAGFVRQSGVALRANAARKDQTQIVCARCQFSLHSRTACISKKTAYIFSTLMSLTSPAEMS